MLTDPPKELDDFAPTPAAASPRYIRIQSGRVVRTQELVPGSVFVDRNGRGDVLGVELLDGRPDAVAAAVAAERARCERIARNWTPGPDQHRLADDFSPWALTAWAIADRILAGGE